MAEEALFKKSCWWVDEINMKIWRDDKTMDNNEFDSSSKEEKIGF